MADHYRRLLVGGSAHARAFESASYQSFGSLAMCQRDGIAEEQRMNGLVQGGQGRQEDLLDKVLNRALLLAKGGCLLAGDPDVLDRPEGRGVQRKLPE